MIRNLLKKKVLIVGGTSGLGFYITKTFLNKHFEISVIGRSQQNAFPKEVKFYKCDVTKLVELRSVIKKIKKNKNYFDIIIHNVGGSQKIFNEYASSIDYQKVWQANLGYAIEINNSFIPNMIKKKWGRIIHISSSAAYNHLAPPSYSSAKAAVNTYVSSISKRLIKKEIVISSICPGPIELPNRFMTIAQKKGNKYWKEYKKNHLPIGRLSKPEEITSVVYFLSSDKASYCSGANWNVDGSEN